MKLAIAQMVLGVIIISDFACLLLLGVGWIIWGLHYYQVYIVLGLLVFGCGGAQFLKGKGVSYGSYRQVCGGHKPVLLVRTPKELLA